MSHSSELIASNIEAYLEQHRTKELLRLLTCGSVDDGKSTLIGRLLHDSSLVYEDQLAAVERDSEKQGTTEEGPDLALLVDGLKAEREQGITIDVAYRYFSTARRKFIIADCPGHEQYTRNMATGASTCQLAIILIDASKGVLPQTRRHSFIVSLLGIRHVIVAVNKMDLVDYDESVFNRIREDYGDFAARLEFGDVRFIPMSALKGDNVVDASSTMDWYNGGTLMDLLETVHVASDRNLIDLRFPVQLVLRPNSEFRGFAGTVASGILREGQRVKVLPSGSESAVRSIETFDATLREAPAATSVVITLDDEIDVSRGDMLVAPNNLPQQSLRFDAMLVWMDQNPMTPGKEYLLKHTASMVPAQINTLRYAIDVNTVRRQDQPTLELNQIGRCSIQTQRALTFDAYRNNRETGAFILIDRMTNGTVAAGMILDRPEQHTDRWDSESPATLEEHESPVSLEEREARLGQSPTTVFFTGLTGAGKTTLAYATERALFQAGRSAVVLDGQNLRRGICKDLGFSAPDRSENLRRFAHVARLFNDVGQIVLGAFVAPHESVREKVRATIGSERFVVVRLDCSLEVCRKRSPLVAKAEAGEILDFPGVSTPYEPPQAPDLAIDTEQTSAEEGAMLVLELLRERGLIH